METENELTFTEVLEQLFTLETVPIHQLFRLSDLQAAEFDLFVDRWSTVPTDRRVAIMRHMADLSEDNFVIDFGLLFQQGLQDVSPLVRAAALDGLWDETSTKPVPVIVTLLETDEDVDVQRAAAAALAHYVLLAEWGQISKAILPRIVAALLAVYDDPVTAVAVRRAIIEALGPADHPRIAGIIETNYADKNFGLQLSAVFAMGSSADRRWVPYVLDEMRHPDAAMRAEAARAAGMIGDSAAVELLAELVQDDDIDVAITAVTALGEIGGEIVSELLSRLAEDPKFEELHEVIDEAIEEMSLMAGDFGVLSWDDGDDGDDDAEEDYSYLNN